MCIYQEPYGYIYETTNLTTNQKYIGQRKLGKPEPYFGSGTRLKRALKKYRKENFYKKILMVCNTKEELDYFEKFFIAEYDAVLSENYYNIADGGQGGSAHKGKHHSPETKALISKIRKEQCQQEPEKYTRIGKKHNTKTKKKMKKSALERELMSKETRDKISKINTGKGNPFYGKKHPKETIELLKAIAQELDRTGEKNPFYGKKHSEETKETIREKNRINSTGEKNPFYGKKHSEESLKKMSESQKLWRELKKQNKEKDNGNS